MANNGSGTNQQALIPMFKGEKYHLWSLKMKTMFRSQELWDLVENGFEDENPQEPDQRLRENRKKDANALFFIQSALDEDILSRISAVKTSHEAWEILKQEYMGAQKIITVKLQTLLQKFETLSMKDKESIQEYLARVSAIVNQMKSYGEFPSNESVVSKVLRSLSPKFEFIFPAIIEANDLSTYTFDQMMSSLIAHEDRLSKACEKAEEKAFQVKGEFSGKSENYRENYHGRGGGRGELQGAGYARGRGYYTDQNQYGGSYGGQNQHSGGYPDQSQFKSNIQSTMASSSSSSSPGTWGYRVFTSFHGPDVRTTFLTHLRKQFSYNGITMFDDQEIERSQIIAPALTQAIRESRILIVVLSKNYASSSWCLDELVEIFKCKEDIGQIVMTIFYEVDPSNVRKQTGEFGSIFEKTCLSKTKEERQKWSKALEDVGNIAGEHFQKWDNESKMIEKIARDVSNKLNATISWDFEDMVGIEAHLQKMQSLLHLDYEDGAMIVGICGPAGIGKTTIARALHSRLSSNFQLNCFMENIRGSNNSGLDEYGLKLRLQEQLLSKILNQDGIRVYDLKALPKRLCDQKVLIILDDVDDLKQLEALAGETNWFGPGSRIIVTTEDQELLKKHDIINTYPVAFPTEEEARKIFCRYAFRKSSKPDGFEKLIKRVTEICSKLPLGLRVMGSYLCKKTKDDWEDILQRLENSLDPIERGIERVLRVGYDSLREKDQLLFLLIAVFFNYKDDVHVKDMLAENKLNVRLGLKTLANKSLIQISMEGDIVMHKLLQQVGREAIQRQDPGRREILIDTDDILTFLENESDRRSVIGISLDISTIPNGTVYINARAFKNIRNLRFLRIYKTRLDTNATVHVPEDMDFPHRLRLLHWDAYPGKLLPLTFRPEFLVELNLRENNLEKLWGGIQPLPNLKKMDLFGSSNLKELPDLSKAEKLEILYVSDCWSLVELPPSILNLHKLEQLEMYLCLKLQVVPTDLFNLASLDLVDMWGCWQLRNIPDISNITHLRIAETMLEDVPDSIRLCGLKRFNIHGSIGEARHIEKLPDWIKDLHRLEALYIDDCPKLASLPGLPASLLRLRVDNCESLETIISFPVDSQIEDLYLPKFLYFLNCFKLDRTARTVITRRKSVEAYLPGRTIPAEFNQRASGNSLTIRSDLHLFRICVVVSPNQPKDGFSLCSLSCDIRINGCPIEKNIYDDIYKIETEHLYMFYVYFSDEDEGWLEQDNEIVFEFSTTSPEVNITQCGVQSFESLSDGSYKSCSEQLSEDDDERYITLIF